MRCGITTTCFVIVHHIQMISSTEWFVIVLLVVTAVVGDFTVAHSKLQVYKALFDNATHAFIGALSWVLVVINNRPRYVWYTISEVFLCTLVASLIDLDHFVAAKSFQLKDATQLSSRPPLHSSTAPLGITAMTYVISHYCHSKWGARLSLLFLTAFASHHTRDATRRGYWFAPFGSTPPIPYAGYILISIAIPYLVDDTAFYVAVGVLGGASVLCIIAVSVIIFYLKHLQEQIVALKKGHSERPNQWEKEESFDYTSVQNDFNSPQIPRLDYNTTAMRTPENTPQQMNWPVKPNVDKPWLRPQQPMQNTPASAPAPQVFPKWKTSAVQQTPSESSRMDYRQQPPRFPGAQQHNFSRNPMSGSGMDRMGY